MSKLPEAQEQLSIKEAASLLKVSTKTLRRWEDKEILVPQRTSGGHRRYTVSQIKDFKESQKKAAAKRREQKAKATLITPSIIESEMRQESAQKATQQLEEAVKQSSIQSTQQDKTDKIILPNNKAARKDTGSSSRAVFVDPTRRIKASNSRRYAFIASLMLFIGLATFSARSPIKTFFESRGESQPQVLQANLPQISFPQIGSVLARSIALDEISLNVQVNSNFSGVARFTEDIIANGGTILSENTEFNLLDENVTTLNLAGSATQINIGATGGVVLFNGNLAFEGESVDGTQTIFDITDPTGEQTITFPNATGEVSLLGQLIEAGEIAEATISEAELNISNTPTDNLILSYNADTGGFTWVADQVGDTSYWARTGSTTYLNTITDDVVIGSATPVSSAKFSIDGDSDQIQLLVQANSSQTTDLFVLENASGTDLMTVDGAGNLDLAGNFTSTGNITASGDLTLTGQIVAGTGSVTLTTSDGYIDADAIQLIGGAGTTTSSQSGLQIASDRIGLLQGCANGEILKWNSGTSVWECSTDTGAEYSIIRVESMDTAVGNNVDTLDFRGHFDLTPNPNNEINISIASDSLNFTELSSALTLDEQTTITNALASNFVIDLTSSGDFVVASSGSPAFTVTDTGAIVIGSIALSDTATGGAAGADLIGIDNTAVTGVTGTTVQTALEELSGDIAAATHDPVSLSGGYDYLTLSGQDITLHQIDLTADVSGTLPTTNGGTGLSTIGAGSQLLSVNAGGTGLTYRNISDLISAGSGIGVAGTSTITVSNTGVLSLTGTSNQINVSGSTGAITLSLPQDIHTGATPTFAGLTVSGLGAGSTNNVVTQSSGTLQTRAIDGKVWSSALVDYSQSTQNYLPVYTDSSGTIGNSVLYQTGGNIGIGTTNPTSLLSVAGDVTTTTDFHIGSVGLTDAGSATTSGAYLIGAYDEFDNAISSNVQGVLNELDAAISGIGGGTSGLWRLNGTSLYPASFGYSVGIGTSAPTTDLDVAGSLRLREFLYDYNNSAGTPGFILQSTANGVEWIDATSGGVGTDDQTLYEVYLEAGNDVELAAGTGDIRFYNDAGNDMLFLDESTGRVGIGTTAPASLLHVAGTLTATTITDGTININGGTLDLGTNTITDGNFNGNWAFNSGNLSGINNLTAAGIITFSGLSTGNDNTVLILNSSNQLVTDEIDGRVWGSSLVDYTATSAGYISLFNDANTITNSALYQTGGNIGIGTTSPSGKLDVAGDIYISNSGDLYSFGSATLGNRSYSSPSYVTSSETFTQNIEDLDTAIASVAGGSGGLWRLTGNNLYPQDLGYNVGIGTSTPATALEVTGTVTLNTLAGGAGNAVVTRNTSTNALEARSIDSRVWGSLLLDYTGANTGYLGYFNDSNTLTASPIYTTGGNIGIGTTDPGYKLDIAGSINTSEDFYVGGVGIGTTAGAGLLGADSSSITQSSSNYVQGILEDLDSAITSATHDPVTLAGSYDYLTLNDQEITLNQIDLTTDVTGVLPYTNGGTGLSTLGTGNQLLGMDAGGTAITYRNIADLVSAGSGIGVAGTSTIIISNTGVLSLTGTANQINVDQATGAVTLSLPQDIHTAASPQFAGLNLTSGGITNTGSLAGVTTIDATGDITTSSDFVVGSVGLNDTATGGAAGADLVGIDNTAITGVTGTTVQEALEQLGSGLSGATHDPVTLVDNGYGFVSLSGQELTLSQIDLASEVTGTLANSHFSAYSDLTAEGYLDNNAAGDLLTRTQSDSRYLGFSTITTPSGTSPVADLYNDELTFTAGTDISITGDASGDSIQIAFTGTYDDYSNWTIGGDTGTDIDVTSGYVVDFAGGTGISTALTANTLTITNDGVTSLAGTTNQVNVSGSTGAVTLSLPQDIHTAASPTFAGLTLSGLSGGSTNTVVTQSAGGALETRAIDSSVWGTDLVTASGTSGYLPYFTGADTLANSALFQTGGNVGIGTTDPSGKLDVAGDIHISNSGDLYSFGSATLGNRSYSSPSYVTSGETFTQNIEDLDTAINNIAGGSAGLWRLTGSSLYPADLGYNVGIGTSTPSYMLDVAGSINTTDDFYVSGVGIGSTAGAALIGYDNAVSGLTAATVQAGIDELASDVSGLDNYGNWVIRGDTGSDINVTSGYIVDFAGGTGISTALTAGTLTITNDGVTSLTGTANQVNISASTGAITLSLPQDIHANATPTFNGLTLDSLSAGTDNTVLVVNSSGNVLTDEIDSRVWGTSLLDYTGTNTGYLGYFSDADTLTASPLYTTGGNVGIGTTDPGTKLDVVGDIRTSTDFYVGSVGLNDTATGDAAGADLIGIDNTAITGVTGTTVQEALEQLGTGLSGATHDPVTLAGSYNYLTLNDQEITLNQIDLSTDVTGTLGTDYYSAYSDLTAEGYLDNNAAGDLLTRTQSDSRYLGFSTITTPSGTSPVADLYNDELTLSAGTDISITGDASGDSIQIAFTGSYDDYSNWTIGGDTGTDIDVTSGYTVDFTGGTGISTALTANTLTITNEGVTSLTGTTNQVNVSGSTGGVTLSLPQDIHTAASPQFAGLNLTSGGITNTGSLAGVTTIDATGDITTSSDFVVGSVGLNDTATGGAAGADLIGVDNTAITGVTGTTVQEALEQLGTGLSGATHDPVTLAGSYNYLTLNDQEITLNQIDLTADVTGVLPYTNGGTGLSTLGAGHQLLGMNAGGTAIEYKNIADLISAGSGIGVAGTSTITISNTGVLSLTGTANQINVDQATGAVTLSLPQDIHTSASPTFAGLTLSGLASGSTNTVVTQSAGGALETRTVDSRVWGSSLLDYTGTNTGYLSYFSDADTLTASPLYTTGSNIGLGTTNPQSTLHVVGDGRFGDNGTTGNLILYSEQGATDQTLTFAPHSAMTDDVTLTFPADAGSNNYVLSTDGSGNLSWQSVSGVGSLTGSGTSNYIPRWSGTNSLTNSLLYDTGAAIGIGTTAPGHLFDLAGDIRLQGHLYDYNDSAGTPGQILQTTANGVDWVDAGGAGIGTDDQTLYEVYLEAGNDVQLAAGTGDIRFYNDAGNEMLFLDESTGRIGIGNTNPQFKLDVAGGVNTTDDFYVSGVGIGTTAGAGLIGYDNATSGLTAATVQAGIDELASDVSGLDNYGNWVIRGDTGSDINVTSGYIVDFAGGTGISTALTANTLTITNDGVTSLAGTANQVNVSASTGAITLSLPQNIHTDATPTFNGLTLDSLSAGTDNTVLVVNSSGNVLTDEIDSRVWGSSLVDGAGTTNMVARFSDGDSLTTGVIYDDGTDVGIGTTNPGYKLDVAGSINTTGDLYISGVGIGTTAGAGLIGVDDSSITGVTASDVQTALEQLATGLSGATHDPVTLAGSYNYLTLNDQEITLNQIDLTADVTGVLPYTNGGTGLSTLGTGHQLLGMDAGGTAIEYKNIADLISAGSGIGVAGTSTVTISNNGVLSLTGTANQVNVSASTGAVTLSLPQNIHTDAFPTFDGLTLDNLASGATDTVVTQSAGGALQTRTVDSRVWGSNLLDYSGTNTGYLGYFSDANTLTASPLYNSAGNIGIGTTNPGTALDVVGDIRTSTDFYVGSIGLNDTAAAGAAGADLIGIDNTAITGVTGTTVQEALEQLGTGLSGATHDPVTLAGSYNYLTLNDQEVTLNQIDLSTDVTGTLSTDRYSAYSDLTAEGYLDNNAAGDLLTRTQSDSRYLGFSTITTPSGTSPVADLYNDELTLSAGTDISITGNSTTDSIEIAFTGSYDNYTDWTIRGDTGTDIDVTSGYIVDFAGGTGISTALTANTLTITNDGVTSLAGTTNQVNVSGSTGAVTLSLPQNIHTDATPTFDGLTLDNLSAGTDNTVLVVNSSGNILTDEIDPAVWGTNLVTASGTSGYLPYFTGGDTLANSAVFQTGGNVGIGTTDPGTKLDVVGDIRTSTDFFVGSVGLGSTAAGGAAGADLIGIDNTAITGVTATNVQEALEQLSSDITGATHDPVTLTGSYDYLTLNDQEITLNQIDLAADVTGVLPYTNGGTGLSTLGTGHQLLGMDAGGTAIEYKNIADLISAGSGIGVAGTSTVTISNTGVLSLTGTANQVNVSAGTGAVTLSLPQNIHTDATPTFNGLTLDSLSAGTDNTVLVVNSSGNILTDEIDGRVWGSSLLDYSGTNTGYLSYFSDADTVTASPVYTTGGNVGIGTTAPGSYKLNVTGDVNVSSDLHIGGVGLGDTATGGAAGADLIGVDNTAITGFTGTTVQEALEELSSDISSATHDPVTLAGSYDYLTLNDQEITLNQIDLSTDVTGTLSTDRYSAYSDLTAEGYLDNNAGTDLLTRDQLDARFDDYSSWTVRGDTGSDINVTSGYVVDFAGGTGISTALTANTLTITNDGVTSLAGTANQVNVSGSTGAVTLSLPQNIHTGASPQFAGLNLTSGGITNTGSLAGVTTIDATGDITTSSDFVIGSVGLTDNGSPTTSGAYLIGANDEFGNSNSTNVQDVLDDLDATITGLSGGTSGLWRLTGSSLYPADLGYSIGIGTSTPSSELDVVGTITGTELTDGTASLSSGTLDLGTNTISDGNFNGNWAFNSGNLSGIGTLSTSGAVTFSGLGTGTDNSVLVLNGSNQVVTDEIDDRVWGTSLLDYSGTNTGYLPYFSDANTVTASPVYTTGGNIGIGTTNPNSYKLNVAGTGYFSGNLDVASAITLNTNGITYGQGVANKSSVNNAYVDTDTTGTTISRNVADANAALIVQQSNASSTGNILELKDSAGTLGVFTQSGRLGIGTTAPGTALDVNGTITATTLDLGTNTISDGNFNGNWAFNSGNLSGIGTLSASGTVTLTGLGTGTDNSVLVLNGSNQVVTDEIDDRVWGTSLLDYSGTNTGYVGYFSDANTVAASPIYTTGGNVGIGTTAPGSYKLNIAGDVNVSSDLHIGGIGLSDTGASNNAGADLIGIDNTALTNVTTATTVQGALEELDSALGASGHDEVTLAGSYNYLTLNDQEITLNQIDLATDVTGVLPAANGGTGLSSLGAGNQILGVNSGGTALEYKNLSSLISAGTGIGVAGTTSLTISNNGVLSLAGTTNQVNVSASTGAITLSLPQNIHTNATPTFDGLTLDNLSAGVDNSVLVVNGSGNILTDEIDPAVWGTDLVTATGTSGYLPYFTGGDTLANSALFQSSGNVGIGTTAPTARLDLAAATTSLAQLNLTTSGGTNVSAPNAGDVWFNGTNLNFYDGSTTHDLLIAGTFDDFLVSGDTGDDQTIADGETLNITGGTNGIDTVGVAGDIIRLDLDYTEISDATFGAGSAFDWTFDTGTVDPTIDFNDGGIVFNEAGNDVDMRFEGSTDASLFALDAGLDAIGIGVSAPSAKLHVLSTTEQLRLAYDGTNYSSFTINSGGVLTLGVNGTEAFNISSAKITNKLPTEFSASGDVSVGYDIVLTNQTQGKIESLGPLTIEAGENYESNNLTLKTYNSGILNVEAAGGSLFTVDGGTVATLNRTTSDGTVLSIQQDGVAEGSISVSSNTVSYNAFTGSHYAWTDDEIEMGRLVRMTGVNHKYGGRENAEIVYGVNETTFANDPAALGSYLSVLNPSEEIADDNPHLIMAVGNGEMWVVDNGTDLAPGDFLISSDTPGHAMRDNGEFPVSYVIARVAEAVNWDEVSTTVGGTKHTKISVLYDSYARNNAAAGTTELAGGDSSLYFSTDDETGENILTIDTIRTTDLTVLGDTLLGDTNITGDLTVGGITFDPIENSIDAIGTLKIQSLGLGNIEFMGGLVTIDTEGNVVAQEVTAEKYNVAGASAGTSTISAGSTSVFVSTPMVTNDTLVFVTAKTVTGRQLSVTTKTDGVGFRVEMNGPETQNVEFDWFIVDKVNEN